jgi:homoprotocatechuate degradation regulator HpaR
MRKPVLRIERRNLPLLLLRSRELVLEQFRPLLNAHGVTEQQWRVVRLLIDTGPLEPREIGELCRFSSPSLAGMLARMEELGLVRRSRFKTDRRRVRVALGQRGRALVARMAPEIDKTYRRLESALGTKFCAQLYAQLDRLILNLNSVG